MPRWLRSLIHYLRKRPRRTRGAAVTDGSKPFLVVYVVWHPDFGEGPRIAEAVRQHFRRRIFASASNGTGVSVIYRFAPQDGAAVPLPINLAEAATTATVVLVDSSLAGNRAWAGYIQELVQQTEQSGLGTRVFPVSIQDKAMAALELTEQALQWHSWTGSSEQRQQQLVGKLTYEFCRMLRHYLERLRHPSEPEDTLARYLRKVQVFLSHSKHDNRGAQMACAVRDRIHGHHALSSFFDVHDIPAGLRFDKVLLQQVRSSAVVAIHTDTYSSREWCRREVIEAKLWNVPLVVANCISNWEDRSFPYMGNVPVIRLDDSGEERIDFLIGRLLDEVLKDFLWRCQVELHCSAATPGVMFIPRPPELISLATLPMSEEGGALIVYPGPPLSNEEERLFTTVAPGVKLRSLVEWTAERFQ